MDHRGTDFHAGWETIEKQSTRFGFEQSNQILVCVQIFFAAMNGSGELSFERFYQFDELT